MIGCLARERYAGWEDELGRNILRDGVSLESLSEHVLAEHIEPRPRSGRQEVFENLVNRCV